MLKISSFWHLTGQISLYVLCKILKQYNKTLTLNAVLPFCTQAFSTTLELLCSHIIQHWLCQGETLIFNNIHLHWHLKQISNSIFIIDSCLMIVNSLSVQSQSHFWCFKTQNSTQWDFSIFEVVKAVIERQQQSQRNWQWDQKTSEQLEWRWQDVEEQTHVVKQSQKISGDHFSVFHLNN